MVFYCLYPCPTMSLYWSSRVIKKMQSFIASYCPLWTSRCLEVNLLVYTCDFRPKSRFHDMIKRILSMEMWSLTLRRRGRRTNCWGWFMSYFLLMDIYRAILFTRDCIVFSYTFYLYIHTPTEHKLGDSVFFRFLSHSWQDTAKLLVVECAYAGYRPA